MTIILNPPIDRELAQHIAGRAFGPNAGLAAIVPLPGGQVNSTAMLILADGRRSVLRIAPDPAAAAQGPSWLSPDGLRREAAVIERAADLRHLLPVTIAADFSRNDVSRDWVLQEVMPGIPLANLTSSLDEEDLARIWREIGTLTRRLHAHQGQQFGALVDGPTFATWAGLVRHDIEGLLLDVARFGLPGEPFSLLGELVEAEAAVLDAVTPVLIHSDLNPGHIFVTDDEKDGSLQVAGVIDLEYGRFADPLSEHVLLGSLTGDMSEPARSAFLEGYGGWQPGPGDDVRGRVATALALAWDATLVAFKGGDWAPSTRRLARVMGQRA